MALKVDEKEKSKKERERAGVVDISSMITSYFSTAHSHHLSFHPSSKEVIGTIGKENNDQ